jgi:mannose-6-phosphate isomerase-like protein (cupin superfamily)
MRAPVATQSRSGIRLTADAVERNLPEAGVRSVAAFQHGTMLAKLYAPRGHDPQQPHTRDEVYVVISGSGTFVAGDKRHPFAPGDFLFVPAHVVHRFENFTDDLRLWVVFYGPEGGEAA